MGNEQEQETSQQQQQHDTDTLRMETFLKAQEALNEDADALSTGALATLVNLREENLQQSDVEMLDILADETGLVARDDTGYSLSPYGEDYLAALDQGDAGTANEMLSASLTNLGQKPYEDGEQPEQEQKSVPVVFLKRNFDRGVGGGVDRDKLAASDFAVPEERKFPIKTPKDAHDAAVLAGKYKGKLSADEVKRRIMAICKRKGQAFMDALPASWKNGNGGGSDMPMKATDVLAGVLQSYKAWHDEAGNITSYEGPESTLTLTIKAGARHSSSDMQMLNDAADLIGQAIDLLEQLGAEIEAHETAEIEEENAEGEGAGEEETPATAPATGKSAGTGAGTGTDAGAGVDASLVNTYLDGKAVPAEYCIKALPGKDRIGGYAVLWGDRYRKDLSGEYFTPETQELESVFKSIGKLPFIYHHAMDSTLKSTVMGVVDTLHRDETGLWYEAQLEASNRYKHALKRLIEQGLIGTSSGTLPGARKVAPDGFIERWTICEISGTPGPMEHRMVERPVQVIKSAYQELGLDLPANLLADADVAADTGKGVSTEDARLNDADTIAQAQEAERLKFELELLELEASTLEE